MRGLEARSGAPANPPANTVTPRAPWVRDDRGSSFLTFVAWFMFISLMILPAFLNDSAEMGMGHASSITRSIRIALLLLSSLILFYRRRLALFVLRSLNRPFIAFLFLVPLSLLWSADPGATLARFVSLMSFIMVCFSLVVMSWHRLRFQQLLRPILMALLIASIIFGILYPDLAIEQGEGTLNNAWRGLTSQKNVFGMLASFGFIFWLHAWLTKETRWWWAIASCGISGACILLSRSSTSLLTTCFTGMLMLLLLRAPANWRRYMPLIVGSFAVAVVIYAIAVLNVVPGLDFILSPFAAVTGKDLTFSARSEIWAIIKEHVRLSPIIGSGYGAYWTGPVPSSPSYVFLSRMYFYPAESHNGYLEIVNDLGFVGLFCLLGYLFSYVRQSFQLMRLDRAQGVLFLCLFFQQAMANLSESSWLSANVPLIFFITTFATFTLARALLDYRLRQHFGAPGALGTSVPSNPG